jgi:hypothetical protein
MNSVFDAVLIILVLPIGTWLIVIGLRLWFRDSAEYNVSQSLLGTQTNWKKRVLRAIFGKVGNTTSDDPHPNVGAGLIFNHRTQKYEAQGKLTNRAVKALFKD